MKKRAIALGLGLALSWAGSALAHPEHDEVKPKMQPKLEVQAKRTGAGASVTVRRDGTEVQTAGATGTLTIENGSRKQVVQLRPAGENTMEAKTSTAITPGTKARAMINFDDKTSTDMDVVIN